MNVLMHYGNFGVFYKNTMNYLTTNPERDVVKHKVDDLLSAPRHLPNTKIPNQHTGYSTIGVIFFTTIAETSQNSSKFSHFSTDCKKNIDLSIRPL